MKNKLRPIVVVFVLLSLCLFLNSCNHLISNMKNTQVNYTFTGNWQGRGVDSEGNEFVFAAKVSYLGDNKYRVLILDRLDTSNKPLHIMEGELLCNTFTYTSDEGLYVGGGELNEDVYKGYYEGPVDGTYKMWRLSDIDGNE